MEKILKYSLLVLGWLLAVIILVSVIAGLLIQTSPVKRKITGFAEKKASEFLKGEVSIGKIEGNIFSSLSLKNVLWKKDNDTLAFFEEFDASYQLLPLLHGELLVHDAKIAKPWFYLKQNKDSTWNVQQLVETQNYQTKSKKSSGNFSLKISAFEIEEGQLKIVSVDTIIPRRVDHLNVKLALAYSSEEQKLNLENLSLSTTKPSLALKKLSFNAQRNAKGIQLQNLYLKTVQNELEGKAEYAEDSMQNASVQLESKPLHPEEFEFFLPGFKLPVSPTLNVNTEIKNGSLNAKISLAREKENIDLTVNSTNFSAFINHLKKNRLKYEIDGNIEDIDLSQWLGDPQLSYVINGHVRINGEGTDPKTAIISMDGDFKDLIIHEKPVDKLLASLNLENGNLTGKIEGEGNFGIVNIDPEIKNLQGEPSYKLELLARKFNLAELTGDDTLQSDINLTANIEGKYFNPDKLSALAELWVSGSRFQQLVVDSVVGAVHYHQKNIQIDSLWAKTQTAELNASGNYNLNGISDLILKANFSGLEEISQFIPAEKIFAEGEVNAHLKGVTDSLSVNADLNLKNVEYNELTSENLSITANGKLTRADTTINAKIFASDFRAGKLLLDSAHFNVDYFVDSLYVEGKVDGEDVSTSLTAGIHPGKSLRIALEKWQIDYKNQHFQLQNSPALLILDSTQYKISNFKLVSNDSDSAQFVMAEGLISRKGDENFQFEVANVNVQEFLKIVGLDLGASGILDMNAEVKGSAQSPLLTGNFVVDKAILNEYEFTDFGGNFGFQNKKLNADVSIIPKVGGSFKLNGDFPMETRLDSMKFNLDPKDSLNANLVIDQFPLAILQKIQIAKDIKGYIEGNVNVKGTLEAPEPDGNLHLTDASLKVPEYGIDYSDITLNLNFLPEKVELDSFYIKSKDGNMYASGTIDFNNAFYKGDVSQSKINVEFHDFNPVNHRQFNMQLSGNANLQGKKGAVVFGGDLTVPESQIYLPAIFNMFGRNSAPDIPDPILVQKMKSMGLYTDSLSFQPNNINQNDSIDFSYFDNFTGTLNIDIPKNSWIKNKDMYIEISGDLELRKNRDFFEFFGSLDVVRGQYDLLGKTFIIDKGTINFEGGKKMMPRIDITASYSFRNADGAEQKLTVQVTGTAEEPSVNFSLDGSNINEGDALSYILFGKSLDELSISQQQNVTGAGNLAGTAAAAILSSQLNNILSKNLNVDYIEIKSGGNFENATVVVGKYITNDLFVSYQQRFGQTNETNMAKYEVKLEYELFKFLFLQLNNSSTDSGFDVIFKLNSE